MLGRDENGDDMDVTAASGISQAIPVGVVATPRVAASTAPAYASDTADHAAVARAGDATQDPTAAADAKAAHDARNGAHDDPAEAVPQQPRPGGSVLKFDVASADVLARFSIDEDTKQVFVTMFQRDTGQVLREIPPRSVVDVMAALSGRGLTVDTSS